MEDELKKIFIVDDNLTNLAAARNLLRTLYQVYPAQSAAMFFNILEKVTPDLILLDIEMPEMNGYETMQKLKDTRFKEVPVIFLTAKSDEDSELRGFELGAVDYISKPFSPPLLKKRIENQLLIQQQKETIRDHASNLSSLVSEKTFEVFKIQNAILQTVADLVEFRDSFTGGHTTNSQLYMEVLLNGLIESGVYAKETVSWDMDFILPSVLLHDIGKIAIPDVILNKPPDMLDAHEQKVLRRHVTIGKEAVKRMMSNVPNHAFLQHALNMIESHHENWDGTGYPKGYKGRRIPLEGRLMAVVNVYDSLVSWRPYKKAFPHNEAVSIIVEGRGTRFDPELVDVFLKQEKKLEKITYTTKAKVQTD